MTENRIVTNNGSSIVLYTTDDGNTQLEVKLENDTVWLTQSQRQNFIWKRPLGDSSAYIQGV